MRIKLFAACFSVVSFVSISSAQQIGWVQNTYGTFSYYDPANWVNGEINGIFGTNITRKSTQTITFDDDFRISNELFSMLHKGEVTFQIQGASGNISAVLDDTFIVSPPTQKGSFRIGSSSDGHQIDLNLEGKSHRVESGVDMYLYNSISAGEITFSGSKTLYMCEEAPETEFSVLNDSSIGIRSDSPGSGGVRASKITLNNARLLLSGNNSSDTIEEIAGDIVIDKSDAGSGAYNEIQISRSNKNVQLKARSIDRRNSALLRLTGTDTGFGEAPSNGVVNVFLEAPPQTIGGGGQAGQTDISIVPWIFAYDASSYTFTLATYGENGLRPLNLETEYASEVEPGSDTWQNLKIPNATTYTNDLDTAVNSVYLTGSEARTNTVLTGTGTLRVKSGVVVIGYHRHSTPRIETPIDFGTVQGVIIYPQGKESTMSGPISGSGGVVFAQPNRELSSGSSGTGMTPPNNCTYTGDTYVFGNLSTATAVFPFGDRTGDLYNYGIVNVLGGTTINGLYGGKEALIAKAFSGAGTLTIGDNDSDGDYAGRFSQTGDLSITKIGTGTQRFSGSSSCKGATTVEEGMLILDGAFTNSAFYVKQGAVLKGSGSITKPGAVALTVESGAALVPGGGETGACTFTVEGDAAFQDDSEILFLVGEDMQSGLVVNGSITGSTAVTIDDAGEGAGKWLLVKADAIEPVFVRSPDCTLRLSLENNGTELWGERPNSGTVFLIR